MTSTIAPEDTGDVGARTINIAPYIDGMRPMRRPAATGEFPIVTRPAGFAELERLSAGETLILPVGATPAPPRDPVPAVYEGAPERYRGTHRKPEPSWAWALVGAAAIVLGQAVAVALVALAVTL